MSGFVEVPISEFFILKNGQAKFIRDYIDARPGPYPVYSASLLSHFGMVNEFAYEGRFLTWVMNGYGGRIQEICGRFSANRDRGVFIPREGVRTPNLTYVRYNLEPLFVGAAVGRRVDGRANDYTKLYPPEAEKITLSVPITDGKAYDYEKMEVLGERYRKIESAQARVSAAADALNRVTFPLPDLGKTRSVSLSDKKLFELCIGDRVLTGQHVEEGVPVYSANALVPFGNVAESNLGDFSRSSLLWGIDGNFDWNFIEAGKAFATTDHCGRLQTLHSEIDTQYLYYILKATRGRYGFDRVYRASLRNMRAEVTIEIPVLSDGEAFDLKRQREIVRHFEKQSTAKARALALIAEVNRARVVIA